MYFVFIKLYFKDDFDLFIVQIQWIVFIKLYFKDDFDLFIVQIHISLHSVIVYQCILFVCIEV